MKVVDDGRGIPVDKHAQTKKSALETVLTTLHAGAKFGGKAYQVSGGLHGVGVSVVNALSIYLKAEVCRDGFRYEQEYSRGKVKGSVKKVGPSRQTGTTITFEPDGDIFKEKEFDFKRILTHLRQQAYLTPGVKIVIKDQRGKEHQQYAFYFEGGLGSYIQYLTEDLTPQHDSVFYVKGEKEGVQVEASLRYTEEFETYEESFANNIGTQEGGMHLTGFRTALTRTLNDYGKKNNFLKGEDTLTGEDVREGMTAVVSVKIKDPQFEGQTKAKLGNPEAKTAVEAVVGEALADFLERNPQDSRAIIEKCLLSAKARKAAKAARQTILRKGALEGLSLPGKLADCSSRNPEESELYIVEGESAGGCFSGDTMIALADGRSISFENLIEEYNQGKKNYCYTVLANGSIGIELIEHPRKTKTDAEVLKVILDNGGEIICTSDHRFMLGDGSYTKARDLQAGTVLKTLLQERNKKPAFSADSLGIARNTIALELSSTISIANQAILSREKNDEAFKPWTARELHPSIPRRQLEDRYCTPPTAYLLYSEQDDFKKVQSVVLLEERIDVYDLEVKGTHNFALASGVFVHNSGKQARDRRFQAILPLRGKILNVERARLDKILDSKEIRALVIAVGTAIGEDFDIEKARYHRIIIMTDADVDGSHIRALLLTLFYRYLKPIIDKGYLYIAQPPLYRIQMGKQVSYAYAEAERDKILASLKKEKGVSVQRYKGLGEMNPGQLWETTMSPSQRILLQVNVEDAKEAEKTFDVLMGDEVLPRKKFIQTHAKSVKNLDI